MKSFAICRMNALLRSQLFGAAGALVWSVSDMLVAGNIVGVDALAGIAATVPVFLGAQFLAKLVYCGAGYLFARRQGKFDVAGARQAAGLALEAGVVVGVVTYLAMFFGRDIYFDFMGLTGGVREQAVAYWTWMSVVAALNPFAMAMWRLVYADGEMVTTAIGDLCAPFLVVGLSIAFTKMTGSAAGSALGTLVGGFIADSIMMLHLLRQSNAVRPKWCFSLRGLRELVTYSLTDSSTRLCQSGFMAVLNKMIVFAASTAYLPVAGLVMLVLELREMLDKVGDAYMPIAEMYLGEGNLQRLRELARYGTVVAVVSGFVVLALVWSFAPQIVSLYGIPAGAVYETSVHALKVSALTIPISSMLCFLSSHYLTINRVALSVVETVLEEFVLTAGCVVALGLLYGLDAIWFGLPIGGALTLVLIGAYGWRRNGCFLPMFIPADRSAILNLTFVPVAERIVEIRDAAERFLLGQGVLRETVSKIMLLVEECAMTVADDNGGRRVVLSEVSLSVSADETCVILRDTGRLRDITDGDARVSSLRSFVVSGLMQSYEDRRYLMTIGCNRAAFAFRRQSHRQSEPRGAIAGTAGK